MKVRKPKKTGSHGYRHIENVVNGVSAVRQDVGIANPLWRKRISFELSALSFERAGGRYRSMSMLVCLIALCSILFLFPSAALAETEVSGTISQNTTWILANSPYIVTGSILVNEGITLTVEPGVTVKFDSGTSLQVDGELIARGTDTQMITFTSNSLDPAPGDWGYILFTDTSTDATYDGDGNYTDGSILEYCIVEYAGGVTVDNNGAVRMDNAHLFINHCTIQNNSASGIYGWNLSENLKVINSTISNNTATSSGGGFYASGGTVTISNNTLSNNTAGGGGGGGVAITGGTATISNNTIFNNNALGGSYSYYYGSDGGGGIYVSDYATATISDNTVINNTASLGGGGIYIYNGSSSIFNNFISQNTAAAPYGSGNGGGGIGVHSGTATISFNYINNNIISGDGGGICVYRSTVTISDNTISYNETSSGGFSYGGGGGIMIYLQSTATISNNIISNNKALYSRYDGIPQGGGGIYVSGGTATISNNSIIRNSASNASAVYCSSMDNKDFKYNTITKNQATGSEPTYTIYISGTPFFNSNNIFNNIATYELWNDNSQGSSDVNAENNWWGTATESDIQAKIYDLFDDSSKGIVEYSPWLTAIELAAPIPPPSNLIAYVEGDSIFLSWDAVEVSDLAGYKVYYETDGSGYPYTNCVDVGNSNTYTISGIDTSKTYFVAVTAYDIDSDGIDDWFEGHESWFSNEVIDDNVAPIDPAISINSGEDFTTSRNITVSLSTSDDVGITAYYILQSTVAPSPPSPEDDGWVSIPSATNYSADVPYTLTGEGGEKAVYVWFKDDGGNISLEASDSIILAGIKLWDYETGGAVSSSPAVVGGRVYVGSNDGNVYCFDIATGAKVWAYKTGGAVQSPPAISGGRVYVGSGDGKIYCLDAATGAWLWEYQTVGIVRSSPSVSDGKVYLVGKTYYSYDMKFYCLDARSGAELWQVQVSSANHYLATSSPSVSGGKVYVGSLDNKLYCFDAQTGAKLWEYQTGGQIYSSPAISGAKVYAGSDDSKIYCLDAQSGAKLWEHQTGGAVQSSPAVSGGRVFIGSHDNKLYCLDAESGARLWEYQTGYAVYSSPSVSGNRVYVGSYDDKLYCFDALSGAKLWEYQTGGDIYSSPAVSDGKVIFGSYDNKLYCLDAGDPDADGWPMFRHDLQHTGDPSHYKTEFLYGLIQAGEITEFSEYELQLIEVYEDNDFPVESGVQFSVSDPNIASISGNTLMAITNGRVVISADYDGAHYQRTLFLMTSPDWGMDWDNNTKETADALPSDEFWQGDMVAVGEDDIDYYELTIDQDSIVEICYLVEGSISDTRLELFDASDNLLVSTISNNGRNKILSCGLTAGIYYLKLTPAGDVDQDSSYYISYTLVGALGPREPIEIGLGQTEEATLYSLTDVTYFQFQLAETQDLDIAFDPASLEADYQVDLLDQEENLIKRLTFGNGRSALISVGLRPGDYTLKVTGTQDVDVENPFSVSLSASSDQYEIEFNDTYQQGTEMDQDISLKGYLDDNDLDFYAFSLDAPRYIRINFTAETYGTEYNITLYKGDDQSPIDATVCQKGSSAFIEVGLTADDYYLKVEHVGDKESHPYYTITLTESTNTNLEIESNNTLLFANALDSSHPKQGRIYSLSDVDYYGFYVPDEVRVEIYFSSESSVADYKVSLTNGAETSVYQKISTNGEGVELARYLPAGNYYVKVEPGEDVDPYSFYNLTTTTVSLAGLKTLVGISLAAQTDQVNIAATLQISAMGNYSDATQALISGAVWSSSDDTVATVDQSGLVTGTLEGYATIYASLGGQVGQLSLTVGAAEKQDYQAWGNLILVAGGGVAATNTLKESTQYLSDMVYARFLARGFEEKDIYYFNPITWHDIDGDGYCDRVVSDDSPTVAELRQAVEVWAAQQESTGPLYLVIINHGGIDTFEVFPGEIITASQLNDSISAFENATGRKVVILIEACKSGSLVDDLALAGSNRMVITCTDEGNAYLELKGRISFTQFFMDSLFSGDTFRQSFLKTTNRLANCGRPYSMMNPQLAEGIEYTLSQERLGGNFAIAGLFPEIVDQTEDLTIPAQTMQTFSATISDLSGQTSVWAVVEPPDYRPPAVVGDLEAPEVSLPTFDLTDEDNNVLDGVFEGSFSDFIYNGQYRIVFYARNADGLVNVSPPTLVTVTGGIELTVLAGDVNDDKTVNLADAILVLQVLAGVTPAAPIYHEADVNGDGKIGLAEALYIMQKVAGLRD